MSVIPQSSPETRVRETTLTDPALRTALVVVGMHRTGTSALTRVLSLLGATLPHDLYPPGPDNPEGFWEPAKLVEVHEEHYEVRDEGQFPAMFTARREGAWSFVAWEAPNALVPDGRLWVSDGGALCWGGGPILDRRCVVRRAPGSSSARGRDWDVRAQRRRPRRKCAC